MYYCNIVFGLIVCYISAVSSFSWQTCSKNTDPLKVISLNIDSAENKMLYVTGKGKIAQNITSPIKAKLEMYKKFFWGWTEIPCVDQIGSCEYEDICSLSPYTSKTCPQQFLNNNLPCKCPILKGQYAAKRFPVDLKVLPHWIESGRYKLKITLKEDNDNELLCLLMSLQV